MINLKTSKKENRWHRESKGPFSPSNESLLVWFPLQEKWEHKTAHSEYRKKHGIKHHKRTLWGNWQ